MHGLTVRSPSATSPAEFYRLIDARGPKRYPRSYWLSAVAAIFLLDTRQGCQHSPRASRTHLNARVEGGGIGEAGAAGPLGCTLLATHAAFLPPSGGGLSEVSLLGLPCRSTVVTTCAVLDTAAPD
jgi:hypothetical protein